MKTIQNLSYREWQKRNTESFSRLSPKDKGKARRDGYKNIGWRYVESSWEIVKPISLPSPPIEIIDKKLDKGDFIGALNNLSMEIDSGMNELEKMEKYAHDSLLKINELYDEVHQIAQESLSKHKPL